MDNLQDQLDKQEQDRLKQESLIREEIKDFFQTSKVWLRLKSDLETMKESNYDILISPSCKDREFYAGAQNMLDDVLRLEKEYE